MPSFVVTTTNIIWPKSLLSPFFVNIEFNPLKDPNKPVLAPSLSTPARICKAVGVGMVSVVSSNRATTTQWQVAVVVAIVGVVTLLTGAEGLTTVNGCEGGLVEDVVNMNEEKVWLFGSTCIPMLNCMLSPEASKTRVSWHVICSGWSAVVVSTSSSSSWISSWINNISIERVRVR